jgi:hypothetical protein
MAKPNNPIKSHSAQLRFTTADDVALYERIAEIAQQERRSVEAQILLTLTVGYPEQSTPAEG